MKVLNLCSRVFLLVLCFCVITATPEVFAKTITIAAYDFPPLSLADKDGKPSGVVTDIMRNICKEIGVEYEYKMLPVKRAIMSMTIGRVHMSAATRGGIPKLLKLVVAESKNSIYTVNLRLYALKDKKIDSLNDVVGKKLILMSGYAYDDAITNFLENPKNKIEIDNTYNHESAILKLMAGRGDYLLDYAVPIDTLLDMKPELKKKSKEMGMKNQTIKKAEVVVLLSKFAPNSKNLMLKIDSTIEKLRSKGDIK